MYGFAQRRRERKHLRRHDAPVTIFGKWQVCAAFFGGGVGRCVSGEAPLGQVLQFNTLAHGLAADPLAEAPFPAERAADLGGFDIPDPRKARVRRA